LRIYNIHLLLVPCLVRHHTMVLKPHFYRGIPSTIFISAIYCTLQLSRRCQAGMPSTFLYHCLTLPRFLLFASSNSSFCTAQPPPPPPPPPPHGLDSRLPAGSWLCVGTFADCFRLGLTTSMQNTRTSLPGQHELPWVVLVPTSLLPPLRLRLSRLLRLFVRQRQRLPHVPPHTPTPALYAIIRVPAHMRTTCASARCLAATLSGATYGRKKKEERKGRKKKKKDAATPPLLYLQRNAGGSAGCLSVILTCQYIILIVLDLPFPSLIMVFPVRSAVSSRTCDCRLYRVYIVLVLVLPLRLFDLRTSAYIRLCHALY